MLKSLRIPYAPSVPQECKNLVIGIINGGLTLGIATVVRPINISPHSLHAYAAIFTWTSILFPFAIALVWSVFTSLKRWGSGFPLFEILASLLTLILLIGFSEHSDSGMYLAFIFIVLSSILTLSLQKAIAGFRARQPLLGLSNLFFSIASGYFLIVFTGLVATFE
ncbi:MAG: hypothetical protein JWM56_217 [Candidatus Peribacteria bacterium]|nr:hypothetical protein [Candidatus Peribacteria bacterium]